MHLSRPWIFLVVGTAAAIGILRVSIDSIARARAFSGCPVSDASGEFVPTQTVAFWQNQPVAVAVSAADSLTPQQKRVLGVSSDEKWIEVDLSEQKLTAHQGETIFLQSPVSTGLWAKTPPGEYRVWYKIRSTKMEGGNKANNTYYYLPNVPYNLFFYKDYGIHGTYWHSNFGQPMSHGCVNAPTPVAEKLFYWADPQLPEGMLWVRSSQQSPGTRVVVHD